MRGDYMGTVPRTKAQAYVPRSWRKSQRWHLHGAIWRTLAQYEELSVMQLVPLTGLSSFVLYHALTTMGGVTSRWEGNVRVWRCEPSPNLDEWREVLL